MNRLEIDMIRLKKKPGPLKKEMSLGELKADLTDKLAGSDWKVLYNDEFKDILDGFSTDRKLKKRPKDALDEVIKAPTRKLRRVIYNKKQCSHIMEDGSQCKSYCVGRDLVCHNHGGNKRAEETMKEISCGPTRYLTHTTYNPGIHPMQFITLSIEGMSVAEIARDFSVSVQTIMKWSETYPEFAKAFDIGKAMLEAWWINQGKDSLDNRFYQTGLFKFMTGNILGWSEKVETKNLNNNQFGVLVVPGRMTMDEWEKANMVEDGEILDITPEKEG